MAQTSQREERAAQNELVFRAVNEQILRMTERFRAQLAEIDVVCECADAACVSSIRLRVDDYVDVERAEGTFLVLPGHEDESVEDVVRRTDAYVVVWKRAASDGDGPG